MTDGTKDKQSTDYTFGQLAIKENACTFDQVKECLDVQDKLRKIGVEPKRLGEILVEKGFISTEQAGRIAVLQTAISGGKVAEVPSAAPKPQPAPAPKVAAGEEKVSIPGYELISKIGQGGMGAVYKARQLSMDRVVAIKVLSPKFSQDRSYVERFLREARAVARLNHENVISGIDVGDKDGLHYFVMEFVEGRTVSSMMKHGPLPEKQALNIALQIARALEHAHHNKMLHRDIKPENIMITGDGTAKLCDLGLAKQTTKEDAGLTMDGMSVGTPNYISPEQARGEDNIDLRTDIYSLGASLYHMVTGVPPYDGPNPTIIMTKHVTEPLVPPRTRRSEIGEPVSNLICKMMMKHREERHQTPQDLISDIEKSIRGESVGAPRGAPTPKPNRAPTRRVERKEIDTRAGLKSVHHATARAHRSKSGAPVAVIVVLALLLGGGVFFLFAGIGGGGGNNNANTTGNGTGAVENGNNNNATNDEELKADHEKAMAFFTKTKKEKIEALQAGREVKDVISGPWGILQSNLKKFAGNKYAMLWEKTRDDFQDEVKSVITPLLWKPIHTKAETAKKKNFAEAIAFAESLDRAYLYYDAGGKKGTPVRDEQKSYLRKLDDEFSQRRRALSDDFEKAMSDGKFDIALDVTDDLEMFGGKLAGETPLEWRKRAIKAERDKTVEGREATSYALAEDRLKQVSSRYTAKRDVVNYCNRLIDETRLLASAALSGAQKRAAEVWQVFQDPFDKALQNRDIQKARGLAFELLFGPGADGPRPYLLSKKIDEGRLKHYLNQTGPKTEYDWIFLRTMIETAYQADGSSQTGNVARALRWLILIESALSDACLGAEYATDDRPKAFPEERYTDRMKFVGRAVRTERKPGEPHAITAYPKSGGALDIMKLETRDPGTLGEFGVVNLMARSYDKKNSSWERKAVADDYFHLRACVLYCYAGKWGLAKGPFDKIRDAKVKKGLERWAPNWKGLASAEEEDSAEKLYDKMTDDLASGKIDQAKDKCKKLIDGYTHTIYMKGPCETDPNPAERGKSRLDRVREFMGEKPPDDTTPKGPRKPIGDIASIFKGKYQKVGGNDVITYDFQADDQYEDWLKVEWGQGGSIDAEINNKTLMIDGMGTLFQKAQWDDDVRMEVTFVARSDHSLGFILGGEGTPWVGKGYMTFIEYDKANMERIAGRPIPNMEKNIMIEAPISFQRAARMYVGQQRNRLQLEEGKEYTLYYYKLGKNIDLNYPAKKQSLITTDRAPATGTGRAGLCVWNSKVTVKSVRFLGKLNQKWLEDEFNK